MVTLRATANDSDNYAWPAVTVVFVLETTPFDGAYDPTADQPGRDPCAQQFNVTLPSNVLCAESNADSFFAASAGAIADSLAAAHPNTRMTFGLVDYFATHDRWDNQAGFEYHVDVGGPVDASNFGSAVDSTFVSQVLTDGEYITGSDMQENFLQSSSITALYGTLEGVGIDWTNDSHHVIVWIGSTAPRDPNYPVNYCPSPSAYAPANWTECQNATVLSNYSAPTCEPSYSYGTSGVTSPECEGWVSSQNGNVDDSIAALARGGSPSCANSLGGNCTIDALLLPDGPTESSSPDWGHWGASALALNDTGSIWAASCRLAIATGGSWDGPVAGGECNNSGSLFNATLELTSPHGPYDSPNNANPTLFSSLLNASLGSPPSPLSASGVGGPMFTFVTVGNIEIDPYAPPSVVCTTPTGPSKGCQQPPTVLHVGGRSVLEWNWSTDPNSNALAPGDTWTASIPVIATGPPFQTLVPVDACTTRECEASHSISDDGYTTSSAYRDAGSSTALSHSFPLSEIVVVAGAGSPLSNNAPPPPPATGIPPPVVLPTPVASPVPQPVIVASASATVLVLSVPAAAGGLLSAGFTRVWLRARPTALPVGVRSSASLSRFDVTEKRDADRQARFD